MTRFKRFEKLAAEQGWWLGRKNKHAVYTNGQRVFVTAATPSDSRRAEHKVIADFARICGLTKLELQAGRPRRQQKPLSPKEEAQHEPEMQVTVEDVLIYVPEPCRPKLTRVERHRRQRENELRNAELSKQAKLMRRQERALEVHARAEERKLEKELEREERAAIRERHPSEECFVACSILHGIITAPDEEWRSPTRLALYMERVMRPFLDVVVVAKPVRPPKGATFAAEAAARWDRRSHIFLWVDQDEKYKFWWDGKPLAIAEGHRLRIKLAFRDWAEVLFPSGDCLSSKRSVQTIAANEDVR